MCAVQTLPRWDMSVVFPGLDSSEFDEEFRSVILGIRALVELFDENEIGRRDGVIVSSETVAQFETVLERFAALLERLTTLQVYISCFVTTDSRDDLAQSRLSELQQHTVKLSQLGTRFTAWIGSCDVDELIKRSPAAADHAYMLQKAQVSSQHLMSQEQEDLVAALELSGSTAWSKLHGNVSSQLTVAIDLDGETQQVPMTVIRNLAMSPDREVRRKAYEAELVAWKGVAVPLAAALNSIKGESNTLDQARKWGSALDVALFNNNIDRETLDAMLGAARDAFPDFRRYLRAKARVLGSERLPWFDLFAPVGTSSRTWEWDTAVDFLLEQFGAYSERLRAFGERAFRERWVDAEPREGKRGGAFCTPLRRGESRILSNYETSYNGVSTLAHELGHAYHNLNLATRTPFQRALPMTLAETASTFSETLVREAALARADEDEQLAILESSLQDACQVVVDISSRFLFEGELFARREQRELSVDELNELMLEAQRRTYGDGLDPNVLHPYMWAVKGHYYSAGRPFYNFPYMFGLLFGLGLYAQYRQDPERFRAGYDRLLSSSALADAATLAAQFGIDVRSRDFWVSSLDIVRADVDRFERLTGG